MNIVMHCMGMPFDGTTIEHRSLGGSESAAFYLARELVLAGHNVKLFTNTPEDSNTDGVDYISVGNVTEDAPLGERFHFYAMQTPHDVMIIQRSPVAFRYKWASKINLWWVHDLALYRYQSLVQEHLWNIDGILTVSDYHSQQMSDVYGINPDAFINIQNGIDLDLYSDHDADSFRFVPHNQRQLVYSSRPERGLENLVAEGGIMERLGEGYMLVVCGYENTTEAMADYYAWLYERCDILPNVRFEGALNKAQLADLMMDSDLLVYPTTFEEVSCITAMEAMAAGLPMVTSAHAALPETCKGAGTRLLPIRGTADNPSVSVDAFVQAIKAAERDLPALQKRQLTAAKAHSWSLVSERLEHAIMALFSQYSDESVAARLINNSDMYASKHLPLSENTLMSVHEPCYKFMVEPVWDEHYAAYYNYEAEKGVSYGPESLAGEPRFEAVASKLADLPSGAVVVDYGCAHGHYTINLAKRYPNLEFIGIDIAQSNIDIAKDWAATEKLGSQIQFVRDDYTTGMDWLQQCDAVIAAEVLEHMEDPRACVDRLELALCDEGLFIVTVPYGPWEAMGYRKEYPWRAHVHHFEREDIIDMFGHKSGFVLNTIPQGVDPFGEAVGSHLFSYSANPLGTKQVTGAIDYERKLALTAGKQTLSLCMIAYNAEDTIAKAIDSVIDVVNEVVVFIDEKTTDATRVILEHLEEKHPLVKFQYETGFTPLNIGFDSARNDCIAKAHGDWILWLDADEVLHNSKGLVRYLRNNGYQGYAIAQHHFSMEPAGILKTDLPVKLFRNNRGIRFFGRVHEHPETGINKGVGHAWSLPDVSIAHDGYSTEAVRRERFKRNIDLLKSDRDDYPQRTLGKMLWIRDVAQSVKFALEAGQPIGTDLAKEAVVCLDLWRELVKENLRMAIDALQYYSALVSLVGPPEAVEMTCSIGAGQVGSGIASNGEGKKFGGVFANIEDFALMRSAVESESVKHINSRYA